LIVCNLTKPESTLEQVKKTHTKLKQTDAALVATALVLSGRYALAAYEGMEYNWPGDYEKLTKALIRQLLMIQISEAPAVPVKKTKAQMLEEEAAVECKVGLKPNYSEASSVLGDREDLKTLFSDILDKGVEFQYTPQDIGWQWALDRANWSTMSDGELTRRVKLKATFEGATVGIEMGLTKKKPTGRAAKAEVVEEVDVPDVEIEPELDVHVE